MAVAYLLLGVLVSFAKLRGSREMTQEMLSPRPGMGSNKTDQKNGRKVEEEKSKEQKEGRPGYLPFFLCFLASFILGAVKPL